MKDLGANTHAPNHSGVQPKKLAPAKQRNKYQRIVAPDWSTEDVVKIFQDAWFTRGDFSALQSRRYDWEDVEKSSVYVFVISGKLRVGKHKLQTGDDIGIEEATNVEFAIEEDAEI